MHKTPAGLPETRIKTMTNKQITITWRRVGNRHIEYTITRFEYGCTNVETRHCNGYATFVGPAAGRDYEVSQVHGYASSVWAATDRDVSRLLRRAFKAGSVRRVAA